MNGYESADGWRWEWRWDYRWWGCRRTFCAVRVIEPVSFGFARDDRPAVEPLVWEGDQA